MTSEIRTNSITSRAGLSTVTLSDTGPIVTGIATFGVNTKIDGGNSVINVGTALTIGHTQGVQFNTQNLHSNGFEVNNINASGIITATSFKGDGSQLTGITGTTINNNADNRIITGSGTANTLEGEADLTFDGTNLKLTDHKNMYFGTGNDLRIWHDANNSYSQIAGGSMALYIDGLTTYMRSGNGSGGQENAIVMNNNASVDLYYSGTKKFETTSTGATITGKLLFDSSTEQTIKLADNRHIHFGDGVDLKIFHESSSNDNVIDCTTSRPLRIRMGGSNQFEFLSGGGIKMNDGRKVILGDSSDLKIEHNGSHSKILHNGTGDLIIHSQTGAMDLQHHHNTSIKTTGNGPEIGDTRHLRWASGNRYWTGEFDNKIQYHSNNLYNQYTSHWVARNASGTNTFTVDSSGNFSSDIRKKENITTVTDALTKVSQLRGVEFKWKEKYGNKEDMGLIAQEVETVLPKLIQDSPDPIGAAKENEDGTPMKMLNYNGLFSVMVEAIKDLKTKVEKLEEDNIALRTRVTNLEGN